MHVSNQAQPSGEQAMAFFSAPEDGPMCMVNLLKFKPKAEYADGSDAELSGREAYMRYGAGVMACIAAVGGKAHFTGLVTDLMIGEVEELWDMVAIAEYPSRAAFHRIATSPEVQAIGIHREAGLAGAWCW